MSTNTIHIGEVPVCSEAVVLPLVATATGTWAFMTNFNGAYQYIQFPATANEKLVVPAKLNEDYTYTFKLYKPDNAVFNETNYTAKTIPLLPDIDYVCPSVGDVTAFTTGKLQFTATEGQTTSAHIELMNVLQVALFVEGAMRQEGAEDDEYIFNKPEAQIEFNTPLQAGQKITILYFK